MQLGPRHTRGGGWQASLRSLRDFRVEPVRRLLVRYGVLSHHYRPRASLAATPFLLQRVEPATPIYRVLTGPGAPGILDPAAGAAPQGPRTGYKFPAVQLALGSQLAPVCRSLSPPLSRSLDRLTCQPNLAQAYVRSRQTSDGLNVKILEEPKKVFRGEHQGVPLATRDLV